MNDWNDAMHDAPAPIESGLEEFARRLDEQRYPGPAWTPPARHRAQPRLGRLAAWIAAGATAAAVACAVNLRSSPRSVTSSPRDVVQGHVNRSTVTEPAGGTVPLPSVFVVEDLDSYSIIDTTGDVAVISFATKAGFGSEWLVALPRGPSQHDR